MTKKQNSATFSPPSSPSLPVSQVITLPRWAPHCKTFADWQQPEGSAVPGPGRASSFHVFLGTAPPPPPSRVTCTFFWSPEVQRKSSMSRRPFLKRSSDNLLKPATPVRVFIPFAAVHHGTLGRLGPQGPTSLPLEFSFLCPPPKKKQMKNKCSIRRRWRGSEPRTS